MLPSAGTLVVLLLFIGLLINPVTNQQRSFDYVNDIEITKSGFESLISNMDYQNIFLPTLGVVLIAIWMMLRVHYIPLMTSGSVSIALYHALFLVFIVNTRGYLKTYLKVYVYVVIAMSFLGSIASLMVISDFYPLGGNHVNLNDLTNGSFSRDEGVINSYVFPYYFGLILTGETPIDFLNIPFYRASGWAHEPTSAALFIVPALFLTMTDVVCKKYFIRALSFITIFIFWILCASIGSFIAVSIIFVLYTMSRLYIRFFPFKMSFFLFLLGLALFIIASFYLDEIMESSLFASKFDLDSETLTVAIREALWFLPNKNLIEPNYFYYSHLIIYIIIAIFLWIIVINIIGSGELNIYCLILFYIVLHSMKGSQESVYSHIFVFFWFYLAYFSTIRNLTLFNK